jgi:acyl-CoA dehydrogenase
MRDAIDTWLARCPAPAQDPLPGMAEAGLLKPVPDYATLARIKAGLVERTGLLGVGSVWGGRQLVFRHFARGFGTEAQQAEWSGRALSVAISEPKVGAHPKLLTTRAEREGAEQEGSAFRITGQKAWVSNGPSADAIIVFAITAEEQGRKRYSAFIVPRDTPGLSISEMPGFHALRPSRHCLVGLDGCLVPATAMLGPMGAAYERMALPFRDIEDAVGTFGTLGALRHAAGLFAGATLAGSEQAGELGAIVALTAVFEAGAAAVVAALDDGHFRTGDATLVGLRILATDLSARLRGLTEAVPGMGEKAQLLAVVADLDATLAIARGPRLARQTQLGEAALRTGERRE